MSRKICLSVGVILLLTILLAAQAPEAQQVCYAYDRLGRLVGVVDPQGRTAIYDYDSVGNILAIRRNDATGPVAITLVTPEGAASGDQVQILGIGFSTVASENNVTIGGVGANVLSAVGCTLTIEVPPNAASGAIQVTTPLGSAVSPNPFTVISTTIRIAIFPAQAVQVVRTSRLFTATVTGTDDQRVTWSVEGAFAGYITGEGIYTAPSTVPTPATFAVRATSVPFPEIFGEATVTIAKDATEFVQTAVSVSFGPPPPGTINASAVSVFFGVPPPSVFAQPVSVANAPVITLVSPGTGAQGQTLAVTMSGSNLTGATQLVFLLNGQADSAITVGSLNINAAGDELTTDITIALSATPGPRVVVIKTTSGNSTAGNSGNNVFEVTAP